VNPSHLAREPATSILVRSAIVALFIEGGLWSAIRLLSFVYVMGGEAMRGPETETPGWLRLKYVGVSVGVAAIVFLAGGGLRNGAGIVGRAAQILAAAMNVVLLVLAVAAFARFSGGEAVVTSAFVVALAVASLAGLVVSFGAAVRAHRPATLTGRA
jgi:hypothetical protein